MREKPASTNSRRTISGELAPGSVIRLAVNSTRFSFYLDTCRCRRPSDILAASSGFATPSTMASGSNRNAECVRTANGRIADLVEVIRTSAGRMLSFRKVNLPVSGGFPVSCCPAESQSVCWVLGVTTELRSAFKIDNGLPTLEHRMKAHDLEIRFADAAGTEFARLRRARSSRSQCFEVAERAEALGLRL